MRRLIQNTQTREFFTNGEWTFDPNLAQDFPNTPELLTTCSQYRLKNVELVLRLGFETAGTYPVRLSLAEYC